MRKAFRILSLLLVTVLVLSGCSSKEDESGQGDLLARIQERGYMIVATEGTWAPWTFHDENDELVGYDIEVAQGIADHLGVDVQFVEGEWDGLFAGLNSQRYDIVANGVEVTPERAETYDFSVPYGYIHTAIIVQDDNDEITSFEDLDGKTTANTLASTYAALAESYGAEAVGVDDLAQTIELLREKAPQCKIVVGGAVMNEEYARRIGADKYAKDAMETVRYMDQI